MSGFTRIWAFGQWAFVAALFASPLWAGAAAPVAQQIAAATGATSSMRAFASEAELKTFLDRRRAAERLNPPPPMDASAASADAAPAPAMALDVEEPPPATKAAEGITNVQTAGVDEGGIVKKQGDLLIVLRRGRLFTIDASGGGMRPIAAVDVFPGKSDADGTWYDEMLVSDDTVVVLGYSYARSGTEVNRFHLSADGKLTWRDTHYLRSGDYYASRNYASRLIGDRLIFYAPLPTYEGIVDSLPALATWQKGKVGAFKPFTGARDIYMPQPAWADDRLAGDVLHSVMICDLGSDDMDCDATNVLGSWSRSFYVSQNAVYVWAGMGSEWSSDPADNRAMLYRIPLDGGAPRAVEVAGMPLDQFSFREEGDGSLNVLTMDEGGGDAMWAPERSDEGDMALLHLAASRFGDGGAKVTPADFRALPGVEGWERQNRFVGDWLLYAGGQIRRDLRKEGGEQAALYAVPVKGGEVVPLDPGHQVGRIDIMGRDAIIVGSGGDGALTFTTVALDGTPKLASRYAFPAAAEVEDRRRAARDLSLAGTLDARPGQGDDHCLASCVDWYGNARPVFFGGRIFALMGYELVEGHWQDGKIRETARIDFTPRKGGRSG